MAQQTALVTGASGLLGRQVLWAFEDGGWNAVGTGLIRAQPPKIIKLDLLDAAHIEQVLDEVKPQVVVHCAANRFPDACSADPDAARALNVSSSAALAKACSARNALLIYISTDYVFSGAPGEAPYRPSDPPAPTNVYGRTKLEGEEAVLSAPGAAVVVLRVPILYGHAERPAESAVNVLVDQIWAAQRVRADRGERRIGVDDWAVRYPTNTADVGRVCRELARVFLERRGKGDGEGEGLPRVLHFSAEERFTKWEMVRMLGEILDLPVEDGMEPVRPSEEELRGSEVKRPYDCHLDTTELKELGVDVDTVGFETWWRRELRAFRH